VTEKSQTTRGDRKSDPKRIRDVGIRRERHPAQASRKRDAARDAVDAVHEVVGVGETDDPQKRDDDPKGSERKHTHERNRHGLGVAQYIDTCRSYESLHRKADGRRQRVEVIAPAKKRNHRAADQIHQHVTQLHLAH